MAGSVMEIPDYIFKSPTSIVISGATGSGKTVLVKKILTTYTLFSTPPARIIYCYGVWQSAYQDMVNVEFRKGIDVPDLTGKEHTIIVFDDLMAEIVKSQLVEQLFVALSHHRQITLIVLVQNVYQQGRVAKTLMLNTHYLILMNNSRDIQQIKCLARQTGMGNSLVEAYMDCMKENYGYLLVDLSPHRLCHKLRLRTHIFPDEVQIVYLV